MITQVYTAQTAAEAGELSRLGVDHVGVTISARGLPGEVDFDQGRVIVNALRDSPSRSVALTVETDMEKVREFTAQFRPDILHLCGDTNVVGPEPVADLRDWIERSGLGVELMQAIGVIGMESVDLARDFEAAVDWIILDSVTEAVEGIGASGVTHDWDVSREIVAATSVPVILAGGLGADNVARAIAAVRPSGVDSLTRTNRYRADGTFVKDLDAVGRFVEEALRAAGERPGRVRGSGPDPI